MVEFFDEDGNRFTDPAKVAMVRRIQELRRASGLSLRKLAAHLSAQGIRGANGGEWAPRTLRVALAYKIA